MVGLKAKTVVSEGQAPALLFEGETKRTRPNYSCNHC